MDWLLAMTYGALGGAVVEAVVSSDRVLAWNAARRQAPAQASATPAASAAPAAPVPALTAYLDPLSDVAAGITRILLGAAAGWLFHTQVTGAYAAIAVGCAVPTVLRQLGSARLNSAVGPAIGEPTAAPVLDSELDPVLAPVLDRSLDPELDPRPAPVLDPELDPERESQETQGPEQPPKVGRPATAEPALRLERPATAEEHA